MNTSLRKKRFQEVLFGWHKDHYRDMPWRRTHDPYRILVSEIMLQQTQVDRVRDKYTEFLKAFPTVRALALAPLGEVLRVWSGLGYNRRAKYLHQCAKEVMRTYGGKFPNDEPLLRKLPGIGISTSAALAAFSFGADVPMIDTNIRRILVRVFFPDRIPPDRELYLFAKTLIPEGKGRAWNYAMLDVGATACTARNHSHVCPFAKLHGAVGDFVYKKPQKKFANSRRFYRGKILRALADGGEMTPSLLEKSLGKCPEFREILSDLKTEGLLTMRRGKIALPS